VTGQHYAPAILSLVPDRSDWSTLCPSHFTTGQRHHSTHWTGVWAGTKTSLDDLEKRQISCSCQELNPGSSSL